MIQEENNAASFFSQKNPTSFKQKQEGKKKRQLKKEKLLQKQQPASSEWPQQTWLPSLNKGGYPRVQHAAITQPHQPFLLMEKGGIFIPSLPFLLLNSNTTQTCNLVVVAISTFQLCYRLLSTIINPFQEAKPPNKAWERKLKMKTASLGWNTCLCQTEPHGWFFIDSPSANLNIILWLMKLSAVWLQQQLNPYY